MIIIDIKIRLIISILKIGAIVKIKDYSMNSLCLLVKKSLTNSNKERSLRISIFNIMISYFNLILLLL